jgi:oligoribonuclease NrnB/cAMP/cGMP phosphodiesterase (DHH superfamily)
MTNKPLKLLLEQAKEPRVKLVTHNDLDGKGCEVVGRLTFKDIDVITTKNPKDASEKVREFLMTDALNYDIVFITDISVSKEVAELIEAFIETSAKAGNPVQFVLLDHHGTAEYLNEYMWASVQVGESPFKNSGTNMFYDYLVSKGHFKDSRIIYRDALTIFVEKVRRYDSWEWKTHYSDETAADLNTLFWLLGSEAFVDRMLTKFRYDEYFAVREGEWVGLFSKTDRTVLELDRSKKESYIDRKESQMIIKTLMGREIGVVFAEQYISELGNVLSERHPELAYIMIIDMGAHRVSLRTANNNIDLGKEIASVYGGGGHAKASGFEFGDKVLDKAFKAITSNSKFLTKIIDFINGN